MPVKLYYIREKEEYTEDNILMVVSYLQFREVDSEGKVVAVEVAHSSSEEFPLNNLPIDISNLKNAFLEITRQEFDHICNLYENDIKEFIYFIPPETTHSN